ncbi:MAG TPA: hypothetical protein VFU60_17655 [Ktedonobacterales bacterium]|nr:hypothetical protein [Ktedonobacterales bacterium]
MAVVSLPKSIESLGDAARDQAKQQVRQVERVARKLTGRRAPGWLGWLSALAPRLTHEGIALEQHVREGRFQRSLALITAMSSLAATFEVGTEHYRGSYSQRVMYSPLALGAALTGVSVAAAFSRWAARVALPIVSLAMLVDGAVGFIFHVRGVARKPGGWRIPIFNVIMGPPVFAPLLLGVTGFLGLMTSFLRREDDPHGRLALGVRRARPAWANLLPRAISSEGITLEQDVREGRFQRGLALATALTALFNGVESLYSHYKNNFRFKAQWTPILLTPALVTASLGAFWSRRIAHTWLPILSILAAADGLAGFFYHVRGGLRRPGALHRPLYTLAYGPPVFAPLLFAATGMLGVMASLMRRGK